MIGAAWGVAASQGWVVEMARAATGGLIAAVWQGVLLSVIVALGLRLVPKTPAAVRFAIWFGVFVVVAAMPSARLMWRGGAAVDGHAAWFMLDERWCGIVAAVWVVASLVRASTLLLAGLQVLALWKRATPLELERTGVVVIAGPHGAAKFIALTGSRQAELCMSDDVDRPTVIGFFSPKILIPAWLAEKLTVAELEQIVLHEAGHLSRADDWMNLLQKIALVVFPLNPALAWVEHRLCFERELACDERVLATTRAPKAYAACLASLAEHRLGRRGLALALGAVGRESELGRRVRKILSRGERMGTVHARLVLGGAMLGLLAVVAGLERCPQLVGFAPTADGATVASAAIRPDDGVGGSYSYQPVVFHDAVFPSRAAAMSGMRAMASVARVKKLALRSSKSAVSLAAADEERLQASLREPTDARGMIDEAVQSQQISAADGAFDDARMQEVSTQAEVRSVVQWVVVTSWHGDDGSRMVLTTVRSASPAGVVADWPGVTNVVAVQDQVHPYAAVPVQDGWLVFQL